KGSILLPDTLFDHSFAHSFDDLDFCVFETDGGIKESRLLFKLN
ncbi:hypothetical protein O988_06328, partial [Pseudogymnoascus sp. VKM F-3808]